MHSIIKASALIVLLIYCVIGQITEQSVLQAQWTDCAAYGQVCKCPSDTLCVIRFGGADVWIFKQVLAMSLPCTRDVFGDMIKSAGLKDNDASCYVSFPKNQSKSWQTVADDHHKFTLTNLTEIRYGSERHNVWTYGLLANDTFECNDALLGFYPPNPYTDKKCQVGPLYPQPILEQPLADAGKSFDLLEADALFSVYHGSFIAQMASSSKIECNPNNFGLKGLSSAPCGLVSGYPVQFDNPVAEWFQAETCAKTATCIYTLQEGVTSTTTSATAEYWSLSLAATTSAGMTYKGANFGGQLTGTISAALTLTQTHAYTMTESKSCAASCTPSANETVVLWQWIVNTIEMNFATSNLPEISDSFNTLVCSYMCLPEGYEPLCPPGYCADSTCQTCTEPLFTSS